MPRIRSVPILPAATRRSPCTPTSARRHRRALRTSCWAGCGLTRARGTPTNSTSRWARNCHFPIACPESAPARTRATRAATSRRTCSTPATATLRTALPIRGIRMATASICPQTNTSRATARRMSSWGVSRPSPTTTAAPRTCYRQANSCLLTPTRWRAARNCRSLRAGQP